MLKESVIQIHRNIHKPIAEAIGLPNELYTSNEAFVEDRDKVMAPSWVCIGFIEDLPEPNFVLPIDFMGLPLLVTRDTSDVIRVFHNVCSHRGMHLADKPCRTNGLVRCPYHSWTYQLDGELRGTPHIGGFGIHDHEEFDKAASNLRIIRSTVWLGCIFVNLSGDAIDFKTYVEPLTRQFDELCCVDERERFMSNNTDSQNARLPPPNGASGAKPDITTTRTFLPRILRSRSRTGKFELQEIENRQSRTAFIKRLAR